MNKHLKLTLTIGFFALLAIIVLIIFARVAFYDSLAEVSGRYQESPVITDPGPWGESAADPLVTRGVLVPPVIDSDPKIGATQPQLTLIEFGDFQCPYCADMANVLKDALDRYPDLRLVWKDLPNPAHPEARSAALAARCAGAQEKFWEYHDLLFSSQAELGSGLYTQLADQLNLDLASFQLCLDSQVYLDIIGSGIEQANLYEVDGTPYLFIGSVRLNQAVGAPELSQLIERELGSVDF